MRAIGRRLRQRRAPVLGTVAGLTSVGLWLLRRRRARSALTDEVAIVTGGSRGLGRLIAEELSRQGCRVVLCARDPAELQQAEQSLTALGADVLTVVCDVQDPRALDRLVKATLQRYGRIDLLVNNAGIIQVGPAQELQVADFERALSVMFWGTVRATLAVLPYMRSRRHGRIVNITSIGGKVAVPHLLPYDCAKFATVAFSEGLRAELVRDGVSVTTIVPGLMRTGSHRFASFQGQERKERRWFSTLARLPGFSMSAHRAARQIVAAARRRQAERVLGLPAKLLRLIVSVAPGLAARMLAVVNRLLPAPVASAG
jgi:short-subunit dehydrogenase